MLKCNLLPIQIKSIVSLLIGALEDHHGERVSKRGTLANQAKICCQPINDITYLGTYKRESTIHKFIKIDLTCPSEVLRVSKENLIDNCHFICDCFCFVFVHSFLIFFLIIIALLLYHAKIHWLIMDFKKIFYLAAIFLYCWQDSHRNTWITRIIAVC